MRKGICFLYAVFACTSVFAQLTVNSNGNIIVKGDATPLSSFAVNGVGEPDVDLFVFSKNTGICVERTVVPSASWGLGVKGYSVPFSSKYTVGLQGIALAGSPLNSGRSYGVMGRAGNSTGGYNWGVCGLLAGTLNGAGIYGSSVETDYGDYVPGRYAGYFRGDVRVTGSIYGQILTASATSLQQNVMALSEVSTPNEKVIDKLSLLNAVQYNLNQPNTRVAPLAIGDADTLTVLPAPTIEELQAYSKAHYGFVARDLQLVYPDLVYENAQGELSINYIEMVPLLVQSIQELTAEIQKLKSGNQSAVLRSTAVGDESIEDDFIKDIKSELFQNAPNPFKDNTVIKYTIPQNTKSASLLIYDMNGKQINQFVLSQRGMGVVTIEGNQLEAGMYLYSLIVDGTVIDVKRMILTK